MHVALDHQRELLDAGLFQLAHHLLEAAPLTGHGQPLATLAHAVVGDLAGPRLALDHGELVARLGRRVEPEDLDRYRRPRLFDLLAEVVDQRADAAIGRSRHDQIAEL